MSAHVRNVPKAKVAVDALQSLHAVTRSRTILWGHCKVIHWQDHQAFVVPRIVDLQIGLRVCGVGTDSAWKALDDLVCLQMALQVARLNSRVGTPGGRRKKQRRPRRLQ